MHVGAGSVAMSCREIAESLAREILARIEDAEPVTVEVAGEKVRVIVRIVGAQPRTRKKRAERTACEENILAAIAAAHRARLTTPQVLALLAANGCLHGESTVKYALARLVKSGLLISSRHIPRGYSLPD